MSTYISEALEKLNNINEARFNATQSQKYSSAKTAKANDNRAKSMGGTPVLYSKIKVKEGGKNLDYGCGAENTVKAVDQLLASKGVENYHYDKTYFPDESVVKDNFYDTVTASNLLNVVPKDVREEINQNIYDALKVGGTYYATVGYIKDKVKDDTTGKMRASGNAWESEKDDSYQANLESNVYADEIKEIFGEDNVKFTKGGFIEATKK